MAHFFRLMRLAVYFVIGLFLGGVAVLAHAETIPATYDALFPQTVTYMSVWGSGFSTAQGACGPQAWFPNGCGTVNGGCAPAGNSQADTCISAVSGCPAGYASMAEGCMKPGYSCPVAGGWTLNGQNCTRSDCDASEIRQEDGTCGCPPGKTKIGDICVTICPAGYHVLTPDNGQCEKDCFGDQRQANNGTCECAKGQKSYFSGSQSQTAALQGSGGDCQNGCTVKAGFFSLPVGVAGVATVGSVSQWITPTTTTGAACQGASTTGTVKVTLPPPAPVPTPTPEQPADPKTTPENNKDPESCSGSGGVYMTVNGQGKCASPGPDNAADADKLTTGQKKTTTTNPDGSTTDTTVNNETITNPLTGEQTTKTTTTTTTKSPTGETTGTTTSSTEGKGDLGGKNGNGEGTKGFCQENPQSPICKKSSWTGDCDNAPVCDGDAVQCATAKAVWEHRCVMKWAEKDNDLSNGIDKDNLFGDQAKIDAAMNKNGDKDFDILATFQAKRQNYLTFASSCNPDLSFDFKGVHYTFDTTVLCQIGMVVKVLLHLAAYMALIRMLTVKLF